MFTFDLLRFQLEDLVSKYCTDYNHKNRSCGFSLSVNLSKNYIYLYKQLMVAPYVTEEIPIIRISCCEESAQWLLHWSYQDCEWQPISTDKSIKDYDHLVLELDEVIARYFHG